MVAIASGLSTAQAQKATDERGAVINKEIAFYGLKSLTRYGAEVVAIKPEADGSGAEIELQADALLIHASGKPWFHIGERRPIPQRILRWRWPRTRFVPVDKGLLVTAYVNAQDEVQRVSWQTVDLCSVIALRRAKPSGFWEICLGCNFDKKTYLLLQPNYLNLDGSLEVEWNVKHGLALGHFKDPYGGESVFEGEVGGRNWAGWPLKNAPGQYVRPGRDGWEPYRSRVHIPAAQYVGPPPVEVVSPWSPEAIVTMPGEKYPETRLRILNPDELQSWSLEKLQYAINEIYARYGAAFPNQVIQRTFAKFSWYRPQENKSGEEIEALFTDIERQNVLIMGSVRDSKKPSRASRTR